MGRGRDGCRASSSVARRGQGCWRAVGSGDGDQQRQRRLGCQAARVQSLNGALLRRPLPGDAWRVGVLLACVRRACGRSMAPCNQAVRKARVETGQHEETGGDARRREVREGDGYRRESYRGAPCCTAAGERRFWGVGAVGRRGHEARCERRRGAVVRGGDEVVFVLEDEGREGGKRSARRTVWYKASGASEQEEDGPKRGLTEGGEGGRRAFGCVRGGVCFGETVCEGEGGDVSVQRGGRRAARAGWGGTHEGRIVRRGGRYRYIGVSGWAWSRRRREGWLQCAPAARGRGACKVSPCERSRCARGASARRGDEPADPRSDDGTSCVCARGQAATDGFDGLRKRFSLMSACMSGAPSSRK